MTAEQVNNATGSVHSHAPASGDAPTHGDGPRVLVVDTGGALHARVRAAMQLAGAAERVRPIGSYLRALGEVAGRVSGNESCADVVVASADALPRSPGAALDALTDIAPTARLLLFPSPAMPATSLALDAANRRHVTLIDPAIDDRALAARLLATNGQTSAAGTAGTSSSPSTSSTEPRPSGSGPGAQQASRSNVDVQPFTGDDAAEKDEAASHAKMKSTDGAASTARSTPPLRSGLVADDQGRPSPQLAIDADSTLIEQLLHPQGDVIGAAVRTIQQAVGDETIAFEESRRDEGESNDASRGDDSGSTPTSHVLAGRTVVAVTFANQSLGVLHASSSITAAQLEPWARWLAHWLTAQQRTRDLWQAAMRDELTGAWNRRYFNRFLEMALDRAAAEGTAVTLLLFDIDDFKQYNDEHGHSAGDEILREAVRLMQSAVRDDDVVARIGGDEFAVIFWDHEGPRRTGSRHPHDVLKITQRFQKAVRNHRFPKLREAPGTLTVSGGLATFPTDGDTAASLLDRADAMLLESKRQGKNAITFGPGAWKV